MAAILESRDVSKSFGAVTAATGITIAVGERQVVGVIGANGAGKTTFINMVTGYLKPDSGSIHFLGRDITALAPRAITRLGICRSFQIPQVFANLPAIDNLLVAIGIARGEALEFWRPARAPAIVAAADDLLERYAIAGYRGQPAGTLPQGIRKLLDIAMATAGDPRVALLDEPTSGISADEKFAVMDRLMAALKERRVTILFVEHDMEIVERYAERVIAFYDGRVIADGAPAAVLRDDKVRQYVVGGELHRREAAGGR